LVGRQCGRDHSFTGIVAQFLPHQGFIFGQIHIAEKKPLPAK
jgi:hypothetical protein